MTPVKQFIKLVDSLDREKNSYELFRDFCEMAYCAHAKESAGIERAEELEARYMQIVGTYKNKDTVRKFPELLGIAWGAIAEGGCDFLGSVAGEMEALNSKLGQFFTPYALSSLLARMSLEDVGTVIEQNGFFTLQEPASGSGGMVLAAADVMQELGFDPSMQMLVNAIDISPLCFHMTYLQLTLRGIPALVELGDTLRNTRSESAWTLPALAFHAKHGKLFSTREAVPASAEAATLPAPEPAPVADVTVQLDLFAA